MQPDRQRIAADLLCTAAAQCHDPGPPSAGCSELTAIVAMTLCMHDVIKNVLSPSNIIWQQSLSASQPPQSHFTPVLLNLEVAHTLQPHICSHLLNPSIDTELSATWFVNEGHVLLHTILVLHRMVAFELAAFS